MKKCALSNIFWIVIVGCLLWIINYQIELSKEMILKMGRGHIQKEKFDLDNWLDLFEQEDDSVVIRKMKLKSQKLSESLLELN